jgi:hypothetical protein
MLVKSGVVVTTNIEIGHEMSVGWKLFLRNSLEKKMRFSLG